MHASTKKLSHFSRNKYPFTSYTLLVVMDSVNWVGLHLCTVSRSSLLTQTHQAFAGSKFSCVIKSYFRILGCMVLTLVCQIFTIQYDINLYLLSSGRWFENIQSSSGRQLQHSKYSSSLQIQYIQSNQDGCIKEITDVLLGECPIHELGGCLVSLRVAIAASYWGINIFASFEIGVLVFREVIFFPAVVAPIFSDNWPHGQASILGTSNILSLVI